MKKNSNTLTLTTKLAKPDSSMTTLPTRTLVHELDPAQAPTMVTVVTKPRSRLLLKDVPAAVPNEAVSTGNPASSIAATQMPAVSKVVVVTKKSVPKTVVKSVEILAKNENIQTAPEPKGAIRQAVSQTTVSQTTVSQTNDAAALAAIDTSGYLLPTAKVPGRRGRKPSEFQPENDEVAALNAVERAELKAVSRAKDRQSKLKESKENALQGNAFSAESEVNEEDLERRRQKIKALINLGKERGFLTQAEISDHLPENIVEPEAIEGIISTFKDMGIAICEQAPDAEILLLSDNVATVTSDDETEAAVASALSTVDADFGRTTDPVRMYMREMGSVALLTREGEIDIAKRIEGGLKDMIQAIAACPTTIAEIIATADKIASNEIKIDDFVDGLVDLTATDDHPVALAIASDDEDEDLADDEEEGASSDGAATLSSEQLVQLKKAALAKFADISTQFDKMRAAKEKDGYQSRPYTQAQEAIAHALLGLRLTAKAVEKLCDTLRAQVEQVRHIERQVLDVVVNKCGMPRAHFIKAFPGNETNLDWVDAEAGAPHAYGALLRRYAPAVKEAQNKLIDL